MGLSIPSEIVEQSQMTPEELLLEFAVFLYTKEKLTLAQAARLSNLDRVAFQKELAKRNVTIHLSKSDLDQELNTIRKTAHDYRQRHLAH